MAINCPICGDSFEDGRGLHGHLRFKEDLSGEELEQTFQKAQEQSADEEDEDTLFQQIKRVALHHGITPVEVIQKIRRPLVGGSPWSDLDLESHVEHGVMRADAAASRAGDHTHHGRLHRRVISRGER